ncbi:hypothetical protein [Streptomyces sp. NBC_01190]|uniref:hypothetical protein n=1 Tax=Streptomyces sp. NBC_01190 TaxID=2903767 RepID=UPI00386E7911|nr:hypothetical protein OG519_11545 [Streptomyces sp. NBC_01190]
MGNDWVGTAADVFSSIGTVGAFGTGFVLLRREHRREADRDEEARRAQAARVSAWVELYRRDDGTRELAFHVHNASDMPIYEVELPLPALPGEESHTEFIGLVPPSQTIRRPAPHEWLRSYVEPEPVEIEFLDSAGRHWNRDEQGTLIRSTRSAT